MLGDRHAAGGGENRGERRDVVAARMVAAGADIASAVTDITLNPDPEGRIREWLRVAA